MHPGRLRWNLTRHPWKRQIIFQTISFRFYVNLRGCTSWQSTLHQTDRNEWQLDLYCWKIGCQIDRKIGHVCSWWVHFGANNFESKLSPKTCLSLKVSSMTCNSSLGFRYILVNTKIHKLLWPVVINHGIKHNSVSSPTPEGRRHRSLFPIANSVLLPARPHLWFPKAKYLTSCWTHVSILGRHYPPPGT